MPAGRPSTYDPSYCERIVDCGREGMSVVEMAAEIGVARSTLENAWPAAHPEFSVALEQARDLSQAWWEKQGRTNLVTQGFQSALYSRSMAARFPKDWREVKGTELTGKDGGPIQTTDVTRLSDDELQRLASQG